MIRRIVTTSLALVALALSGCMSPAPAPHEPSVAPSATPGAAAPSTTPAPQVAPVNIPNDCRRLVDPQTYAATFGDTPLNDPTVVGPEGAGAVKPSAPPAGATTKAILSSATQLRCIWRDPGADITYLEATVATVDAVVATQYLDDLPANGYTCTLANGGRQCQRVQPDPQYPVDDSDTSYLRDNVYIYVGQANFPTHNLMGSIVATLWG